MTCTVPYTPDYGCDDSWETLDDALQERATALAWGALRTLTGGLVGNCPVLLRPCRRGCGPQSMATPINPVNVRGHWYNAPCGCAGPACSCGPVCEIMLPGVVAEVLSVWVDGEMLDSSAYRIDNANLLVRQDGGCWPECQDMAQPWDSADAFTVEYVPGVAPDAAGLWAAGVLASEFAKACQGGKCRLPSSVTSVVRQGVSMSFSEGMFAGGVTGIREVDAYVFSINPNHLVQPSRVWSPDLRSGRLTQGV